jgi:hypothetical protein
MKILEIYYDNISNLTRHTYSYIYEVNKQYNNNNNNNNNNKNNCCTVCGGVPPD